jgi:hypothetical protein
MDDPPWWSSMPTGVRPAGPWRRPWKRSRAAVATNLIVVLLNVDNPRWQPQLDLYDVNGIPQLELFNADGQAVGRSLGARSAEELEALTTALVEDSPLPQLSGVGAISSLEASPASPSAVEAGPRSHG